LPWLKVLRQSTYPGDQRGTMHRRDFIAKSLSTIAVSQFAGGGNRGAEAATLQPSNSDSSRRYDIHRCRFGVNYTPSHNWWFCWNDWNTSPIERDLDAIAGLGADHLRIMLIWPYFQPNLTWVDPAQLDRLDQLLALMASRNLDAVVTVFTGQLSGWMFLPPFNRPDPAFYNDANIWNAQELFVRELARIVNPHGNIIGFDFGNELDTCWRADPAVGDAWMARMFALMNAVSPGRLHVNGVDHQPWFENNTFSQKALAARPFPLMHCYPWWTGALRYGGPMDPPSVRLMAGMAALIQSWAGDVRKPIWAEEFNTCIASNTEQQQAEWLDKAVHAAMDQGTSWFTYWDSHDVDRRFTFNTVEYSLGLLTNDGKVKEQGRMFQQLVKAYQGKTIASPQTSLPPPPDNPSDDRTWRWLLDWMGWKPKMR
jgi:endo-1,4-beta-mannosidase